MHKSTFLWFFHWPIAAECISLMNLFCNCPKKRKSELKNRSNSSQLQQNHREPMALSKSVRKTTTMTLIDTFTFTLIKHRFWRRILELNAFLHRNISAIILLLWISIGHTQLLLSKGHRAAFKFKVLVLFPSLITHIAAAKQQMQKLYVPLWQNF